MTTAATSARMAAWLEQAWLTRYLDRELSAEEVAWFEAYALDKTDLLAQIDADTSLRDNVAANPQLQTLLTDVGAERQASTAPPRTARRMRSPRWRAAAAIVLCTTGVGAFALLGLRNRDEAPDVILAPTTIVYQTMRGASSQERFVESASSGSLYVYYEIAVPPRANNVTLQADGKAAVRTDPNNSGFVTFLAKRKIHHATLRFEVDSKQMSKEIELEAR